MDSKLSLDDDCSLRHARHMDQRLTPIEMQRVNPARNMARFYCLEVEHDLFGTVLARRRWGRLGTAGRSIAIPFPTVEAAMDDLCRRAEIKRRRGYRDRPPFASVSDPGLLLPSPALGPV